MIRGTNPYVRKHQMCRIRESNEATIRQFSPDPVEIERFRRISLWYNFIDPPDEYCKVDVDECFNGAMRPILTIAQIFGFPPMQSQSSQTREASTFKIISFRTMYTFIVIILLFTSSAIIAYETIEKLESSTGLQGLSLGTFRSTTFYSLSALTLVIFLWLYPEWMNLMKEWKAMEREFNSANEDQPRYRRKLYTISCLVMIPAIVEHFLSIFIGIRNRKPAASVSNGFFDEIIKVYRFEAVPSTLNVFFGAMTLISSRLISTFVWNYTDLFIMLVSTGISERYKFLNRAALISVEKNRISVNWLKLREKYATLSILVKKTDECISPLILLSVSNNIYVICLQLYNGLANPKSEIMAMIYFFGSFTFLVGRTIAVILLAARINDQSKLFLPEIYRCPTLYFTNETERLRRQLTTDDVALTGMNLFSITRKFCLKIFSVIITYELILLEAH